MAIYWTLCTAILGSFRALQCAAFNVQVRDEPLSLVDRVHIFCLFFMGPYPKVIKSMETALFTSMGIE